ncbi:MAG: hypothetical protein E6H06_17530 [Bacteroidetes bacterium]|nr:MAG: hypothetical protein E6H06_17530 [Bacteroidota bacterium]
MVRKRLLFVLICGFAVGSILRAQKIVYSEPDRDDNRRMNFDVVGKVSGNFLVYKNIRNRNWITLFDNNMKAITKVEQAYLPNDRLINIDFFPYNDFFYAIYQYQKRNTVYCEAVKLDGSCKKLSDAIELDTTHIGFAANNKIYSVISSEDKSKIMVFKINSKNRERYLITTSLFDDSLHLLKKSALSMPMEDHNDYLDEFNVDNDGDFVFTKFSRQNSDMISRAAMVIKSAQADSFFIKDIDIEKRYLDELHVKVDNFNKRYFLTSFYYKERRGNIDGFYFYVWDKQTATPEMENIVSFGDELRRDARGDANLKMAFNDYFVRNIIIKKDGGFIIGSEAFYTTSRYNSWNRWDYLYGSPFMSPLDYYYYSPYYNSLWYRSRFYNNPQNVRYHADNIVILSFDKTGKLQWNNVIAKEQYDDETDDLISYQLMNTGGQLHFLFNMEERRINLLNDYTVAPGGEINRNPTLKNLDKGFEFMAKYGKQVSSHQMIIPCLYRNNICFAKIDFN